MNTRQQRFCTGQKREMQAMIYTASLDPKHPCPLSPSASGTQLPKISQPYNAYTQISTDESMEKQLLARSR
jgi:hypothetical protein